MTERKFKYPCILDPMRDCPAQCELYTLSVKKILELAHQFNETPEEALAYLRSDAEERRKSLRALNARALQRAKTIDKCSHYPDADITQEIT